MKKTIFVLSVMGVLFSGYMSSVKFFKQICAFNEPCPLFFGFPACYIGFALFLCILAFASLLVFSKIKQKNSLNGVLAFSFLGVLFAGYYSYAELPLLLKNGFAYTFGLPTCMLGMVFFILIFIFSFLTRFKKNSFNG